MKIEQQAEAMNGRPSYAEHSDREMFRGISKLLNILSKEDALLILSMTKKGMKTDTLTCNKIGLTRKQYYTRLKQLKSERFIEKSGSSYFQTTFGSYIYENCINVLLAAIKNRKQMAMIDVLKRSNNFYEDITLLKNILFNTLR